MTSELFSPTRVRHYAIVWIDSDRAVVARTTPQNTITSAVVPHAPKDRGKDPHDLALVADMIGDCEEVLIMGPLSMRTALEREYVSIFHRPERIVDIETSHPLTEAEIVERLRRLIA